MVVIGAGFSGLAAALKLSSHPAFNVTVLEGTSRVGGRARTIKVSDQVVEMGCHYFYLHEGTLGNALSDYAISKQLTIMPETKEEAPRGRYLLELLSNGEVMPHDKVTHYKEVYYQVKRELDVRGETQDWSYVIDARSSWSERDPNVHDRVGLREYITRRYSSVTESDPHRADRSASQQVLENLLTLEGFLEGSKKAEETDVPSFFEYADEDGYVPLKHGFQSVADALAREIPSESIHYNKEVHTILWTPTASHVAKGRDHPVAVVCTDGSTYNADHVIVTVSLGVLKDKCLSPTSPTQLFQPLLPEPKLDCIRKLGMGFVNKVFLEFKKPLVGDTIGEFSLFWREEDHAYPDKYPWARCIRNVDRLRDSNVYVVWFSGEDALAVEELPEVQVAEGICLVLEKFLQCSIDRPIRVEKSGWCRDRFFLGSYSYNAIGSGGDDRKKLSEPLDGLTPFQILFAGAATHATLFGTTNAAYESGLREADRLIKLY